MSGSILSQAAFLAIPVILLPILIVAFYFNDSPGQPEGGDRWRRRY
ncbi:hypothetical protein GCM10022221_07380 [Actinocorallia aurea]